MSTKEICDKFFHLVENTFIIEDENTFFLYSPLLGKLLHINRAAVKYLRDIITAGRVVSTLNQSLFTQQLVDLGILAASSPDVPTEDDIAIRSANTTAEGSFAPIQVTLNITTKCPLRCVYCFASTGDESVQKRMSSECGKTAIDFVYESIVAHDNVNEASILFFGEAEPTAEWPLLTQLVSHAEYRMKQTGIRTNMGITTNGFITDSKRHFLADHFNSITLSFDGPRWAQDAQRPRVNGGTSFKRVFETAKFFRKHAPNALQITCVVTRESTSRLLEIINFFADELPGVPLTFEPVEEVGRAACSGVLSPLSEPYVRAWQRVREYCNTKQLKVRWSADVSIVPRFNAVYCGVSVPSFNVDVDGDVVSCFSHCTKKFKYGFFNHTTGQFIFNEEKIQMLRRLNYFYSDRCTNCYAKYQCLGDCAALRISSENPLDIDVQYRTGHGRCDLIRNITLANLRAKLIQKGG